ncbi:Blue-light-activated protein [Lacunisphaera limnophila]|uniref:histidine kinase n=1 Tax=Lacunisphaera limnophila TaxID=1838286 RepID=A0A1D8AV66_9BACT|nr:transporter substrate-binding domain-containing protein [Lacunisphaera limnophila]AOS44782.1 Blue-light-activated protein [Lacunisphaera limnophila]
MAALFLTGARAGVAAETDTRTVGVLTDNYPFSYTDEKGQITGFAFDLVNEIEGVMGLKWERVIGDTKDVNAAFREGRLGILQSYARFPEREGEADFSVPYLTLNGAIIVRKGDDRIKTLADLRGRRVLVHRASMGETILRKAGLGESVVYAESVEDALRKIDRGEADATLATRLTALTRVHYFGLKNIRALDVPVEGYDVRYCIAVQEGDGEMLARINEGLAVLVRTGRYDALYRKWFSHVEPVGYSLEQVLLAVAVGLSLALLVALWAAGRQRRLRRQIARQAVELQASEERYRGVFEGAPDGLLVLEAQDRPGDPVILQVNPAARRLLQTGSGPAPRSRLRSVLAGDPVLLERLTAATAAEQAEEFEHEKPGATAWWRVSSSPLGGRLLVSLRDITEQTQARQRLQQQDEHMRQTQKIEAIGTLAGGIAHDFNNLLTAIMGNTQLTLMNLPPGHPETGSLEQVLKAARRAQQLAKQILTFSRRTTPSRQPVKVTPLVDEVLDFLRAVARGTVEFDHQALPEGAEIMADPGQVHQVLMNIGTNALQAMRGAPGRLVFVEEWVTIEPGEPPPGIQPGRCLRIAVRDSGPGMSREIMNRIFEPFFTTKPMGEGTGLGLAVVHGIMRQHDGAVTVTSEPGRGTCFHLYFPMQAATRASPVEEATAAVPTGRGQMILLVDDDPAIVETVRKLLQRLGYAVSAHLRADEALAEFEASPDRFALVLSDLTMPGLNGLQFATRVRAVRPGLPLVLASGYWGEADLAEARRLGLSALLHKPLAYEMLGRAVAAQLPAV